jgi:putative transposase
MTFNDLEQQRAQMNLNISAYCNAIGISRSLYYTKKKQADIQEQEKGVLEEYLKTLCLAHPKLGYRPIHQLLKDTYKLIISQSSVYRSMKQLGYLQPKVKGQNRGGAIPSDLVPEAVGTVIGLDFTHWKKEPIVNILEYQTRYCLASVAFPRETAFSAVQALDMAMNEAKRLGLPSQKITVKSDHGSTFTADEFRAYLRANSLSQALSAVGKPQGMGRVERFNRSVKEQGLAGFELEVGESSQVALDEYRRYYNECRPHQALGYRTPLEVLKSLNFAGVQ